jgi:flagellar hook protein FlgE
MGIFDALTTAVSGLQSQSFALQNISGNIANASTVGYKGIGTTFEDLIPDALNPQSQVAGGVIALAQQTITTQGTVSASTIATNVAINGDGFFDVQKPTGTTDGAPTFNGITDYTRAGNFQINAQGFLVNGAGYFLEGTTVDPKTGNPLGSVPTVLQFNNNFVPAQATTAIQYAANLPTVPVTAASPNAPIGSITAGGGLNQADFGANNPVVAGTPPQPFVNAAVVGNAALDKTGSAITAGTLLSNLSRPVTVSDTITVNGTVINFTASAVPAVPSAPFTITPASAGPPATPPTLSLNPGNTIGDLLAAVDQITGNTSNPSSVSTTAPLGQVTLNSGTTATVNPATGANVANGLDVTADNSGIFKALGFTSTTSGLPAATPTGGSSKGTGFVVGSDVTTFDKESVSGGAITVFNSAGTPVNVQLRWALTGPGTWNLFYQSDPNATGSQTAWTNVGANFTFNANGNLTSPAGGGVTIPGLTVGGQSVGDVQLDFASGALTQFASSGGTATVGQITQNGFAAGQLQSVAINNNGIVVGTFSNGQNIDLASITLSHFNGTNYLQSLDGQAYAATEQSGAAIQGASGTIAGSSLEGSNTDIADEFSKLIVTQQAYSANTKVITTADDLIQSLLNVLR